MLGSTTVPWSHVALTLTTVGLATVVFDWWLHLHAPTIPALTYLLIVLFAAARSALILAITTSVLAVLCLNYFFMPPVRTFTIIDPQNWVALFTFLAVSVVASNLSSSVRARAREALARRDELSRLFDLSRDILLITESADALRQLAGSIALRFDLDYVAICQPGGSGWHVQDAGARALSVATTDFDAALQAAGAAGESEARERGEGGPHVVRSREGVEVSLAPLRLGQRPIGLLATAGRAIERGTIDTLASIAAIAIERAQFLQDRQAAEVTRQSNELKSTLLASLGHDLRTPLTAIRVAASNLQASWANSADRAEQSEIVLSEVDRLNRLFQNILEMARIDARAVTTEREWVTPAEIVDAAVAQVEHVLRNHRLAIESVTDRTVQVDPRLTSAALAQLIENAAHYSPNGTTVSIAAHVDADGLRIRVRDEGPGIAATDQPHLFERFYRGTVGRQHRYGAGMGLAITRGLLAAEGGQVWTENGGQGGAQFVIAVPAVSREAAEDRGDDA